MPLDVLDEKMRLITIVDAAMEILMVGVWVGFRRPGGVWSCQHLIEHFWQMRNLQYQEMSYRLCVVELTSPRWSSKHWEAGWRAQF